MTEPQSLNPNPTPPADPVPDTTGPELAVDPSQIFPQFSPPLPGHALTIHQIKFRMFHYARWVYNPMCEKISDTEWIKFLSIPQHTFQAWKKKSDFVDTLSRYAARYAGAMKPVRRIRANRTFDALLETGNDFIRARLATRVLESEGDLREAPAINLTINSGVIELPAIKPMPAAIDVSPGVDVSPAPEKSA